MFWLAKLAGYDYEIQYKKGNDNYVADALPRLPRQQIMHMVLDTSSSEFLQKIEKIWEQDADLHALMSHLTWKGGNLGHYTWDGQLLRKKGKLVVGNDAELRQQLLEWLRHSQKLDNWKRPVMLNRVFKLTVQIEAPV
ncbi:hypothetical protein JHK82_053410 [Glycine max]|nr:hypothetical protein JHK82_053410 [Glycine max]